MTDKKQSKETGLARKIPTPSNTIKPKVDDKPKDDKK